MRMKENWGQKKILKSMMAGCLLFNNFSGLGSMINATAIEQSEMNSLLEGNVIEGENILDDNSAVDDSNGGNESDEMTPTLTEDGTIEGDSSESQKPEVEQPTEGEVPSEEDQPEVPEIEIPSEDEQPEGPEIEVPSEEEVDWGSDTSKDSEDSSTVDEEEITLKEEIELFSLENRSAGSGLVQLWQVVPDGQEWKEGKTTSQIMSALQCRPNHNLYSSGGQSEHNTYVNSCYVDDAFYLGEEGNYYKIYLSGYEGKVPKSESHWFELDLNNDGIKVSYEIQTVAYYIPSASTYTLNEEETTEILDVPELNYYDQTLDKYNEINEKSIELYATSTVQSPSYYANESGTLIHYVTNNVTKAGSYSKVTVGKAPTWMNSGVKYYSYDGIYFYTNWRNIKVNGQGAVNQSNPFYNYYQYLPFRSKSNYSASIFDSYTNSNGGAGGKLVNTGQYFYAVQDKYGINGALQYAMGIHESGWGKSSLSIDKNNLFGMNATDNNPYGNGTSFPSVEAGINYHADRYISWGYTDPIDDARYFGSHVGNKGSGMNVKYASDPFWGEKIAGWYYRFDNASGLKDYDYYTIGIKQSNGVYNIRSQATITSSVLYQTKNKKSNLKITNYPVLITGEQNGFYKIKTDTPIINGSAQFNGQYLWGKTYGYIEKSGIMFINNSRFIDPQVEPSLVQLMNSMTSTDGKLSLKGYAYIKGISNTVSKDIAQKVKFVDAESGKTIQTVVLSNYYSTSLSQNSSHGNNQFQYDYGYHSSTIDLSSLPAGKYNLKLYVNSRGNIFQDYLRVHTSVSSFNFTNGGKTFVINRVKIDGLNTVQLTVYEDDVIDSSPENYINRVSQFTVDNNMISYEGYSYVKGINIPNQQDITQKLKFVDSQSGKQVLTYSLTNSYTQSLTNDLNHGAGKYNYDWAKFKGTVDINTLPIGEYYIKLYTNAKGYKYDEVIKFHSSITDFSFETKEKVFNFIREGSTLRLSVTENKIEPEPVSRMSYFREESNKLYVEGYSYVRGVDIPNSGDIIKKLKFVDVNTGKQAATYTMPNIKNKFISQDANHGAGVYNYDWAKFQGHIDISDLEVGDYYLKIYTNAKGYKYDEVITFHSSLADFSFESNGKLYVFERVKAYGVSSLKLTVKKK